MNFITQIWIDNRGQMKDVLILAPSAGQSRARSHLHSTSLLLGQQLSRLTAQHNAITRLTVGSKIIHKTQTCPEESQTREDRKCEGPGTALASEGPICVVYPTDSVFVRHTQSHIAPDTSRACSTHTHAEFTPLLPLIQCSSSTLFRNAVTQSHQLFIKDFCSWSVIDRQRDGIQG